MTPHPYAAAARGDSPDFHFVLNDREFGPWRRAAVMYTTEDFRDELDRVERRLYWMTVACVVVAVLAIVAAVVVVLTAG